MDLIPNNIDSAIAFVQTHGYLLIFLVMVLEGPLITMAAAFAASTGFFDVRIIFFLSLMGDLVGDFIHYSIGYFTRKTITERYDLKSGITKKRLKKLEEGIKTHFGKSMFLIKFTPFLTTPGLLLVGTMHVPVKKYVFYSFIITLPRTIFFTLSGFYLGVALSRIVRYTHIAGYLILAVMLFIIIKYIIVEIDFSKVSKRVKKFLNN
jgi:membrane protein DedA with SNARE-associated domain